MDVEKVNHSTDRPKLSPLLLFTPVTQVSAARIRSVAVVLSLAAVVMISTAWFFSPAISSVSYDHKAIIINGKRRILFSGSIHYPRSTPEMWPELVKKAKDGGLDVIQTYVFWNGHELSPGKACHSVTPPVTGQPLNLFCREHDSLPALLLDSAQLRNLQRALHSKLAELLASPVAFLQLLKNEFEQDVIN